MKKRLGAFVFFDKEGVVGGYIEYLLERMNEHLDKLIIICNGEIGDKGLKTLYKYSDTIHIRENLGFDAGAWKDLFLEYCSADELAEYDEIVLFNDSFFGPIYPLDEMFDTMDSREDLDFWGITAHGAMYRNDKKIMDEHIQSYFIVIRKDMFASKCFLNYWELLPIPKTLNDAVNEYEIIFTKHFEKIGFKWDVYVSGKGYISDDKKGDNLYYFESDTLMRDRKLPFLKRKVLYIGFPTRMRVSDGSIHRNSIEFVAKETDYPVRLIWEQLIRTVDASILYEAFKRDYVHSDGYVNYSGISTNNDMIASDSEIEKKIAVIMIVSDSNNRELFRAKYEELSSSMKVILVDRNDTRQDLDQSEYVDDATSYEHYGYISKRIKMELLESDYFCVIHDTPNNGDLFRHADYFYQKACIENLLKSKETINSIIRIMDADENLGVLLSPTAYYGTDLANYYNPWNKGSMYNNVRTLAEELGLDVHLSKNNPPIAVGTAFWCRSEALRALLEAPSECMDSLAWEYLPTYIAQAAGYYSGTIQSDANARLTLSNTTAMLRASIREIDRLTDAPIIEYSGIRDGINAKIKRINSFAREYKSARKSAKRVAKLIKKRAIGKFKKVIKRLIKCVAKPLVQGRTAVVIGVNPDSEITIHNDKANVTETRIAIQAHVFYPELMHEIIDATNNMPVDFDLYITCCNEEHCKFIKGYCRQKSKAKNVEVIAVENKGRDVLPFLDQMRECLTQYDYICHIHTKKSLTSSIGEGWRRYLFENLLGSGKIISDILTMFENDKKIGIVSPNNYKRLPDSCHWNGNHEYGKMLVDRINSMPSRNAMKVKIPGRKRKVDFAAGSMFWARTDAVQDMFSVDISDLIPEEDDQIAGTILHAVERSWAYVAASRGYRLQRTKLAKIKH